MRLRNINLSLPIYLQHDRNSDSWVRTLLGAAIDRPERQMRPILHEINLDIDEGDRLALIGRNGAGKTTLLNLLTGCLLPTNGIYEVHGSCQALLNVSLGFNQEATVRENILLRGTAMGIPIRELKGHIGPILEFAELTHASAHRLLTLSAGQRMRLGFAISTSVQPDIMLLDEWIGAGDAEFLGKARERMQSRVSGSRILVLASHSTDLLRRVCNRGVVIDQGRIVHDGPIDDALKHYNAMTRTGIGSAGREEPAAKFTRRGLLHGSGYGLKFDFPTHVLFENLDQKAGREDSYGVVLEFEGAATAEVATRLNGIMHAQGWRLSGMGGDTIPNIYHYLNGVGQRAVATFTHYGSKDRRQAPSAVGRLHLKFESKEP